MPQTTKAANSSQPPSLLQLKVQENQASQNKQQRKQSAQPKPSSTTNKLATKFDLSLTQKQNSAMIPPSQLLKPATSKKRT